MIKVFYSGFGCLTTVDNLSVLHEPSNTKRQAFLASHKIKEHRGEFFLPDDAAKDFEFVSYATVHYLIGKQDQVLIICENTDNRYKSPFSEICIKKTGGTLFGFGRNQIRLLTNCDAPTAQNNAIASSDEKPLSETENRATLNIIYGLLEMLKKSGKSQNEIISELENFDYFGMSESNLKKLFAKANNINKREH